MYAHTLKKGRVSANAFRFPRGAGRLPARVCAYIVFGDAPYLEKRDVCTPLSIGKEIHWDWFAGLVPKRTSQIQKEPFAAGDGGYG